MSLMHNKYDAKPEIVFMCYDEIIKSPYPHILDKINTHLSKHYEEFLDLEKIKGLDKKNLLRLCTQRTDKQLFRYLAKTDFDVDAALYELMGRYFEMYEEAELLTMGRSLDMMLTQKFTEKVYLYTEEYDMRVHLDIQNTYHDMQRVVYISGDFKEAISSIEGITTYFINDLDYMLDIFELGKQDYTTIMLAAYAYNYTYNEDEQKLELRMDIEQIIDKAICKFATFVPVDLDEGHFSQLPKETEEE